MNSRILPALALLIAIGIVFAYVSPAWNGSINDTKAAIAADDQALKAASTYASQQADLTTKENAIDPASLARLTTFLPDSVDNVGLILDLNTLASRSGISLSNIDVTTNTSGGASGAANTGAASAIPVSGASPVNSVDLSLSAVGTYAAFQTFLGGIEKSARLLDVRDLIVKGSDTGVYTYQMAIRLYWLR
jgi:Tfp pilus assembly protein PilO